MKDHESVILHDVLIERIEVFLAQERQISVKSEATLDPTSRAYSLVSKIMRSTFWGSFATGMSGFAGGVITGHLLQNQWLENIGLNLVWLGVIGVVISETVSNLVVDAEFATGGKKIN